MTSKTDLLIQYALLIAAENDDKFRRGLGPIHLIKYVYLADLAHAVGQAGQTFTGTRWKFHNFGPWSNDVNNRVEPAAEEIEASKNTYEGKKSDKAAVRYEVTPDERRAGTLEQLIPPNVAAALRNAVKKHGNDTKGLLRDVYLTPPMLHAAPGESLDFSVVAKPPPLSYGEAASAPPSTVQEARPASPTGKLFSVNQRKKIAAEAQRRLNATIAGRAARLTVEPEPRYDEVFDEGVRWLDELAGEPMPESQSGELHFADSVWKDPARSDPEA